jgi:hypothetical protein
MINEGIFTHPNTLVQRALKGVVDFAKAMENENHVKADTGQIMMETAPCWQP